ncbi:MAG: type II toxin-antitoxin system RelE/ParE family toxin [Thiohalomonadales bacterium]
MITKYRITPRALDDLKNIGRYTEQNWGKVQRDLYLKNLEKRFNWLADSPGLGKHRPEINKDFYSYPQGMHVVFYLLHTDYIDIIGVPHKDMDIISYFQPD